MFGLNQDSKNTRSKKRRTFAQMQEGQLQALGDTNSLFFSNDDCFSAEEVLPQRNRFKPFERDPDCEGIAGFQPIFIDPLLLKEFQHSYKYAAHQQQDYAREYEEKSFQTNYNASKYPKDQVNAHISFLISQKRIPEDKAKLIQDQLYTYYNQINKY